MMTPTKLAAKFFTRNSQGPSALLAALNLWTNSHNSKLKKLENSKLQHRMHIRKTETKEMRKQEVGKGGTVYHTQVTMLRVNHCSIACVACLSV